MKGSSSFAAARERGAILLAVLLVFLDGTAGRGYPLLKKELGARSHDYYDHYNTDEPSLQTNSLKQMNSTNGIGSSVEPYQSYIACEPRTFSFEGCTLCFCTDRPNVGLCWDYEAPKCAETSKAVDEQKHSKNNDPHGIW
ncbi:uncharacterized protein LOC106636200 [Copidosoma floridanum]|uniref:uncharacterized protein LOC106636200 n=1 Tax=Copidosoma floridanum TaxID=29053 RepID=UPI0006C971C6|nr:uncharacterized protein LOC106636200 [Copidosoma floridanum]